MTIKNTEITEFHHGETVEVTFNAINRDKTVLVTPASQTFTFYVSAVEGGPALVSLNTSPQITLADVPTAQWLLKMQDSDYSGILTEGQPYYYAASTKLGTDDPIVQAHGIIRLDPSPL